MANKYKLVYNAGDKVIKGSLTGIPATATDTEIIDLKNYADAGFKKVYEAKVEGTAKIYGSTTGVANVANDTFIIDRADLEAAEEPTPAVEIDVSELTWQDTVSFTYDGEEHTVALTSVPEHLTAAYTGNTATAVGEYTASVTFTADEGYAVKGTVADCSWAIVAANNTEEQNNQ